MNDQVERRDWVSKLLGFKRSFLRDASGSVLAFVAVGLPVFVGVVGVGIDLSNWYAVRRQVQGIADAAAIGAVYARMENGTGVTQSQLDTAALAEAERNGYVVDGVNSLTVTPVNTFASGVNRYVDVVARVKAPLYFTSLVMNEVFISAAAAGGSLVLGTQCVIALEQSAAKAIEFSGTTTADIGCGVTSNSSHTQALYVGGNAYLSANPAQAYGDIAVQGSATLDSEYPLMPFSPRVDDPLAGETFPDPPSTCDFTGPSMPVGSSDPAYNIAPSVSGGSVKICGDLHIQNEVNLAPGTYFIHNGDLHVNAGATLIGDEVSILLTGDSSSDVGSFDINGTATIELTAGDSTEFPGVVLGQSRDAPSSTSSSDTHRVNGGSAGFITGIIYVPNQPVEFSGNTSNTASGVGCVQVIANMVTFTGNSTIENDATVCADIGASGGTVGQEQVILVE